MARASHRFILNVIIVLALAVPISGCQTLTVSMARRAAEPAPQTPPDDISVVRDIEFAHTPQGPLLLDVYMPKVRPAKPLPVIVGVFGGGWFVGNRNQIQAAGYTELTRRGFAVVAVTYRLSGVAPFPAQIHDVKASIRWVRAHAEQYGFDPARIAALGGSAGGHLVALLATSQDNSALEGDVGGKALRGYSSEIQAAVDLFGPTDLARTAAASESLNRMIESLLGDPIEKLPELARLASPELQASPSSAPTLIIHGDADAVVPLEESTEFHETLTELGVDSELIVVAGGGHGKGGDFGTDALRDRIGDFLERTLAQPDRGRFTLAMIPDTQNYVDYTHQVAEGFALDGSELFIEQTRAIARRGERHGGDIAFVASVGDVWQHQTQRIDDEHAARGFEAIDNPFFGSELAITDKTFEIEIPRAIEGYQLISDARIPFGVAPGNHDYDAMWSAAGFPPNVRKSPRELRMVPEDLGILHIGGLDNFRSAFGSNQAFFKDRDWYVDHFRGGANSAQVFDAAGYRFLHIALEMQADDEVLDWVRGVLADHPGLPTILSTHDYLSTDGERHANPIVDLDRIDPDHHNSAEELFQKLIRKQDQIFLVLCGHQHGQNMRVDKNDAGHDVVQILADYQDRGQVGVDAGQPLHPQLRGPVGLGDGWFRLMRFDLSRDEPHVDVQTWSSHYRRFSGELESYADWYRDHEQPRMTDAEFLAADDYRLPLTDFRERFGEPAD